MGWKRKSLQLLFNFISDPRLSIVCLVSALNEYLLTRFHPDYDVCM